MSHYFHKPYRIFGGNLKKIELDLSSYLAKEKLKNLKDAYILAAKLAAKSYIISLKVEIDKVDVDKLKTVPADLSKQSNVVNNKVLRKIVYDKLVVKVINIDTSGFLFKNEI